MCADVKVSVIVPVYNVEKWLGACVNSILSQTYRNLEVILVDDGSLDGSPAMCDHLAKNDGRIMVIHKENGGRSLARQTGIQCATGEYIMFVDGDDWIDGETISSCVRKAKSDGADCVLFSYLREYAKSSVPNLIFPESFSYDISQSEELVHRRIVGLTGIELREPHRIDSLSSVCMKLYRTDIARRGRIVEERIVGTSEDTIFNLYALENCRISYIDRCFYHYRKTNTESLTTVYKADLAEKWDTLYEIIQEYVNGSHRSDVYWGAFLNRVACGMIGLGLNEISSNAKLKQKKNRLVGILKKPLYEKAFEQLNISECDLKWKLFFLLCKKKWGMLLVVLLEVMNKLRSRAAG